MKIAYCPKCGKGGSVDAELCDDCGSSFSIVEVDEIYEETGPVQEEETKSPGTYSSGVTTFGRVIGILALALAVYATFVPVVTILGVEETVMDLAEFTEEISPLIACSVTGIIIACVGFIFNLKIGVGVGAGMMGVYALYIAGDILQTIEDCYGLTFLADFGPGFYLYLGGIIGVLVGLIFMVAGRMMQSGFAGSVQGNRTELAH